MKKDDQTTKDSIEAQTPGGVGLGELPCSASRPWYEKPLGTEDIHIGCLFCSTACQLAPMDMWIAVGFGSAWAQKDDETIYQENPHGEEDEIMTVGELEAIAAKDPEHDWRFTKLGPLHGETFQRQGEGRWVCIESNMGFA